MSKFTQVYFDALQNKKKREKENNLITQLAKVFLNSQWVAENPRDQHLRKRKTNLWMPSLTALFVIMKSLVK